MISLWGNLFIGTCNVCSKGKIISHKIKTIDLESNLYFK